MTIACRGLRSVAAGVIAVLCVVACSSKSGVVDAGDGAADAGGPDASTGAGGAGGIDARAAGDGGIDSPVDAGGDVGDVGMTADEVCRAAIRARCERLAACGENELSADGCVVAAVVCPEYLFSSAS